MIRRFCLLFAAVLILGSCATSPSPNAKAACPAGAIGITGDSFEAGITPTVPWPTLMVADGYKINNRAEAGAAFSLVVHGTIPTISSRTKALLLSCAPARLIIGGGTNDFGQGQTAAMIESIVGDLSDWIHTYSPGTNVYWLTMPPGAAGPILGGTALNDWLRSGIDLNGQHVIDCAGVLASQTNSEMMATTYQLPGDPLHFNETGHTVYKDCIEQAFGAP